MKIVHLWDQANYVKNLMNLPKVNSHDVEHFPKLPDFGLRSKLTQGSGRLVPFFYSRLLDNFILAKSRQSVYFEFHSAPLLERHANLVSRSIFHIHGSEVRRINESGQIVDTTSEFTRYALQNAPLVFYSTPELIEVIGKYSKRAIWMPHITNLMEPSFLGFEAGAKNYDLVIPSSFEVWKGVERVLDVIRDLRRSIPTIKIAGLNLGSEREAARQLEVTLFSVSVQKNYHRLLRSSDAAVGQGFGVISAADIESVQLGLRFFPIASNYYSDIAYGFDQDDFAPKNEVSPRLVSHILNKKSRLSGFETKVLAAHDARSVIGRMSKAYSEFLG
jgi:glycosyltransferase involved in cell wall biosynthesis